MSEIFERFDIFSKISKQIKSEIKTFHVFDQYNLLFITKNDQVFGLGKNNFGKCGLGHNIQLEVPHNITELNNKHINQFYFGQDFVLALSENQQLFGWGRNHLGQLGTGFKNTSKEFLKPNIINFPKGIQHISCGAQHTLLLAITGKVYGWGLNNFGQFGCGQYKGQEILIPTKIYSLIGLSIKSVYGSYNRSFVLTNDGFVYSWGENKWNELGHYLGNTECLFEPKLIDNISNIKSICCSNYNTYLLTNEGIYFCGPTFVIDDVEYCEWSGPNNPKLLKSKTKFTSLNSLQYYSKMKKVQIIATVNAEKSVYYLDLDTLENTDFKSLFDFYSIEFKITYQTIQLENTEPKRKNPRLTDELLVGSTSNNIDINQVKNVNPSIYKSKFYELNELGSGGFGIVFKVMNKFNHKFYAVKKIPFKETDNIEWIKREVNTLTKCSGDYVVKYFDSWIENNNCFYIQMELCSENLKNIIEQKSKCFGREPPDAMTPMEYFISSQLFNELVECVKFLHESNPPIIHRDIKPQNILITAKVINKRFLKICDLGIATDHDLNTNSMTHTTNLGTVRYMAPELYQGIDGKSRYSTKADIFSLSIILQELFEFDIDSSDKSITNSTELRLKWNELETVIVNMNSRRYKDRPTCAQLLSSFHLWSITVNEMKYSVNYHKNIEQMRNYSNQFFYEYFKEKLIF